MNQEEQETICKAIAVSCMWGQGGIASVILDKLQKLMPTVPGWRDIHGSVSNQARRESVGVVTTEEELQRWRSQGYWLCNWDADGCMLFNPPPMNGLHKYVSRELAEQHKSARGY